MTTLARLLRAAAALTCLPALAHAGALERQLAKLDPEERAHQACAIKGLPLMSKEKHIGADRLKSDITSRSTFKDNRVVSTGAAVRANHRWYKATYDCVVSGDQMKALTFTYELGEEIPESKWEDLGLWP
jgi:hypothetical protein